MTGVLRRLATLTCASGVASRQTTVRRRRPPRWSACTTSGKADALTKAMALRDFSTCAGRRSGRSVCAAVCQPAQSRQRTACCSASSPSVVKRGKETTPWRLHACKYAQLEQRSPGQSLTRAAHLEHQHEGRAVVAANEAGVALQHALGCQASTQLLHSGQGFCVAQPLVCSLSSPAAQAGPLRPSLGCCREGLV